MPDDLGMDFTMSDIASCIDERRVMEIWQRLKRGEMDVLTQRGLYPRQGQQIVDRVQRRYETDTTFRGIVDRYLSDFEKMLQDSEPQRPEGWDCSVAAGFGRGADSTSGPPISAEGSALRSTQL